MEDIPDLPDLPDGDHDDWTGVIFIELDFAQGFQKCIIHRVLSVKITIKNLLELGGHS